MQKNRIINVGYVSSISPDDRFKGSGTNYQMYQALSKQEGINLIWIPFRDNFFTKALNTLYKVLNRTIAKNMFPENRSPFIYKLISKSIDRKLLEKVDVLYCPFTQLYTEKPVVYMSDALYHQMLGYYYNTPINSRRVRLGDKLQRLVLDNASKLIFPSRWAIGDAINHYNQPVDKIVLNKFGPNIDEKDVISHEYRYEGHLHLLFLGVDWIRKGGDIAVAATKWLNDNGMPSTLHIVGIRDLDSSIESLPHVENEGFLNKNDKQQYNKLAELISTCHCMLLPTKAECAGIAFVESAAYGLPSFTHNTGGTSDYVIDGVNGYTFPLGSTGEDFGRKIKECLQSGELEKMSKSAVELYKNELNWNRWADKTAEILVEVANENR